MPVPDRNPYDGVVPPIALTRVSAASTSALHSAKAPAKLMISLEASMLGVRPARLANMRGSSLQVARCKNTDAQFHDR